MPSILDRLLGRKSAEETKAEQAKAAEDVARARREELARKQQEADAARKRFEVAEAEKTRLAAVEAEKLAAEAKTKAAAAATAASASSWAQAAPAQAAATTLAAGERSYVVVSGDSLSKIAQALYGDAKRWPEIYEANKQVVGDNPNLIQVGQKLRIP